MKMEKIEKKRKFNKKLLIPLLTVFVIGSVLAVGYVVHSLTVQVDVYEPFSSVKYAIIGDGGNWDGVTTCTSLGGGAWQPYTNGSVIDVQGLYAGEGRKFCVKITNEAEAPITYTVSNKVTDVDGNWYSDEDSIACYNAFGEHSLTGEVPKKIGTVAGEKIDGLGVIVSQKSVPVNNCLVTVSVARG